MVSMSLFPSTRIATSHRLSLKMCYYRRYIFLGCGHSTFSQYPVQPCPAAKAQYAKQQKGKQKEKQNDEQEANSDPVVANPSSSETPGPLSDSFATPHPDSTPNPPECATSQIQITEPTSVHRHPTHSLSLPRGEGKCPGALLHPMHCFLIHYLCPDCSARRDALLAETTRATGIHFDPQKWKVRYQGADPVEPRWNSEWKGVGSALGSWVKDLNLGEVWRNRGAAEVEDEETKL